MCICYFSDHVGIILFSGGWRDKSAKRSVMEAYLIKGSGSQMMEVKKRKENENNLFWAPLALVGRLEAPKQQTPEPNWRSFHSSAVGADLGAVGAGFRCWAPRALVLAPGALAQIVQPFFGVKTLKAHDFWLSFGGIIYWEQFERTGTQTEKEKTLNFIVLVCRLRLQTCW